MCDTLLRYQPGHGERALAVTIQLVQVAIWAYPGCAIFGGASLAVPMHSNCVLHTVYFFFVVKSISGTV